VIAVTQTDCGHTCDKVTRLDRPRYEVDQETPLEDCYWGHYTVSGVQITGVGVIGGQPSWVVKGDYLGETAWTRMGTDVCMNERNVRTFESERVETPGQKGG
jgi:hypothetical protein